MPEVVKLTTGSTEPNPAPSPSVPPAAPGSAQAPIIGQTTVSMEAAIAASEGSKIATITGISGASAISGGPGASVSVAGLVDAKLAVELMDAALPSLMVYLLFRIGMKLKKSDLQLTEKEKNTLAPIVQKCLEQLLINFQNPWVALSVSLLTIYGAKVMEKGAVQLFENKTKKIEDAAKQMDLDKSKVSAVPGGSLPSETNNMVGNPVPTPKQSLYEPTEFEIKEKMRIGRHGRKKAIELLKAINQRKLDSILK